MKKFFLSASVMTALLFTGSCQKESLSSADSECKVTFEVNVPSVVQTKAMSNAENADVVYYEIWNSDWTTKLYPKQGLAEAVVEDAVVDGKTVKQAKMQHNLVKGQTYSFIFWAQNKAFDGYDVTALKTVKVNYSKFKGNQDSYDAYYAKDSFLVSESMSRTIYLRRPFAQLNFGASVMATDLGNIVLGASEVTVATLATTFDTINGVGTDMTTAPVTFSASATDGNVKIDEPLKVTANGVETTYEWIAMDYMLMSGDEQTVQVDASFVINGLDSPVKHTIPNVPLKKNYRTNIVGDLFTADADLTIIIEPDFNPGDEIIDVDKL